MAVRAEKSPLGEVHYNELKRLAKSIKQTQEFISKCNKCGLDVAQEMQASTDQLSVVTGLLREFFPDQPGV